MLKNLKLTHVNHAIRYLDDPLCCNDTLRKTFEYELSFWAITSFLASWGVTGVRFVLHCKSIHPNLKILLELVLEAKKYKDSIRISPNGTILLVSSFKVWDQYFKRLNPRTPFDIPMTPISVIPDIYDEINWFIKWMADPNVSKLNSKDLERLRTPRNFFDLNFVWQNDIEQCIQDRSFENQIKFISGTACVGKSSILKRLEDRGWMIRSRGELGSFGGKAKNAAQIGALCAALYEGLSFPNVIGDRGVIDNIIWQFTMDLLNPEKAHCNPNRQDGHFAFVFLKHSLSILSELVIRNFTRQKGVIFIDPFPEANRERMRLRNEGGDLHRVRLPNYCEAQNFAYFIFARLFRYPIFIPAYDRSQNNKNNQPRFSLQASNDLADSLLEVFGVPPVSHSVLNDTGVTRVVDDGHEPDFTFARAVGIYK